MAFPQAQVESFKVADIQVQPDTKKGEALEARLLKATQEYYDLTKLSRQRRYPLWLYADAFGKGVHYFLYDPYQCKLEEMSEEKINECMYTPTPLLQQAVETIASQYGASNGRITSMPVDSDDPKIKTVVRGLREYADYIDWKFYQSNPAERQTECKLIPLRGVYNLIEFDKTAGAKIQLPQYEPVQKQVCGDCGEEVGDGQIRQGNDSSLPAGGSSSSSMGSVGGNPSRLDTRGNTADNLLGAQNAGHPSRFDTPTEEHEGLPLPGLRQPEPGQNDDGLAACPACASPNLRTITAGLTNKGIVEKRIGEAKRHIFDAYQVEIYDRNRSIEESPYLICDDILFKTQAKKLYPHLKDIKGSASLGNYQDGYIGLHFLQQLQCLIGNTGALNQAPDYMRSLGRSSWQVNDYGSFLSNLLCWRRRVWFDLDVYADWPIGDDKPVMLPGRNEPIPPETKMGTLFPDGLCFTIINGDCVVLTENQDKNAVWSFCGYRMPSAGLHGTGVGSLISMIRGYDAANSFGLQALLMAALGIIIADERVPKVRNVPGSRVTIPQSARLGNEAVSSLVARLDMGGAAAISAAEPIKEGFRGNIGSMTMANNQYGGDLRPQGLGADTATAARLNAGSVGMLANPPLELYAAHRAHVAQQAILVERANAIRPSRFGKFGDTVTKEFDAMSVPEDVRLGVAEESWRMRTLETQREDVAAAAQIIPIVAGNEPLTTKVYQVFGLDDDIDESAEWEMIAQKRMDALKALALQFQSQYEQAQAQLEQMAQVDPQGAQMAAQQVEAQLPLQLIQAANASPLPMEAKGHPHFIHFYENVRLSDEWDTFPPILQQAIQRLWAISHAGQGQAGAMITEEQVMAQAPALQAQQQQAGQAQAVQSENEQGKLQAEGARTQALQEHESQGRMLDAHESERQRRFQSSEAEKDRKHEKEIARTKDKARAKP